MSSAPKISVLSDINFEIHRPTVELNLSRQVMSVRELEFPKGEELIVDVNNPKYQNTPRHIVKDFGVPEKSRQVIYILRMVEQFSSIEELRDALDEIEQEVESRTTGHTQVTGINEGNKEFQLARFNDVIFYVGTSADFGKRLREHVGYGSLGTATLCLRLWPILMSGEKILTVQYYDFGTEIQPESLKLFESEISKDLRPLMGHNRKS